MSEEQLNLAKTALVIIDLQKGIAGREGFQPYTASEVLEKNKSLAAALAGSEALIVNVHVKNYGPEALRPLTDGPALSSGQLPSDFSDFVLPHTSDPTIKNQIEVAKHNWGAFYGTDLDLQLRRRGIDTILLTGIATTIGCDTTAREAYQHGYQVIAVEDAMTDFSGDLHQAIVAQIFTRLGRVRSTAQILALIEAAR